MAINLHHLRVFATVAEQGGFSRAATTLRLSQPAVSKSVRALERQLGLALVDRSGRTPRLTDAGRVLHARARELFGVERAAEEEVRALRGLERGSLRIGASTTIATYLLPPVLARFRAEHPRIALRVASENTRAIARLLLDRRIDVALVEGPVQHARIEARPWRDDELVVIAPPGHPLTSGRAHPVSALTDAEFIARERGSGTREVSESALAAHGITPRYVMQLGSTEAIKQAVAAGLGLAVVSRAAAADQLALGRIALVSARGLTIRRTLTELRLRGRHASAATLAFEALLAQHADGSV